MSRETAIRATHASLNLKTLEALANKGLLRRAQKDLEAGALGDFRNSDAGLTVAVGSHQVTLVEAGPAKATCDCPAPGVCQHILSACLAMLQPGGATPPPDTSVPTVREEWLALPEDVLLAVFPLPLLRSAHETSINPGAVIQEGPPLIVRFPWLNAEVHALAGVGFDGIIVHGPDEKSRQKLAAAAILVVRAAAGNAWSPPPLANNESGQTPIQKEQVLDATIEILEELTAAGLARISLTMADRLEALAISASTSELHRLSLSMRRMATQVHDWLARRPHADLGSLFAEMSSAYALAHALRNPANAHLEGTPRETYIEIGSVELNGVAAWPWRTASGYEGLTLLLWDVANSAWNTWSEARPKAFRNGFDAIARFHQPGPWDGANSPAQLSKSNFRLLQAKRNRWGRLSASAQTKALVSGPAKLTENGPRVIRDWGILSDQLSTGSSIGLREQDPRNAYQVIAPTAWERLPFDPIQQALVWRLSDERLNKIELRLPFDEFSRAAIESLESETAELQEAKLVGICTRAKDSIQIVPVALIQKARAVSLFLDRIPPPAAEVSSEPPVDNAPEEAEEFPAVLFPHSPVAQLISTAIETLNRLAESGCRSRQNSNRSKAEELANTASALRLANLAAILNKCSSSGESSEWLRARRIVGVMQSAAAQT